MNRGRRVALVLAVLALAAGCSTPSRRAADERAAVDADQGALLAKLARDDLARYDKALAQAKGGKVVVPPPPEDPDNPPQTRSFDKATVTADGMRLTVVFEGGYGCLDDYLAEATEGANAVVIVVNVHSSGGPGRACAGTGGTRTATVILARPLGARAVLEVVHGQPVPTTEETPEDVALVIREHALEDLNRYGVRKPPPSWAPGAPLGQGFKSATVTANGRRLTVAFTGAKGPATVRCGADYSAEAVEGVSAVIVILTSHPHRAGETCTQVGYPRTAALTLAHPLGKRAVLEVVRGLPVPVKKAD